MNLRFPSVASIALLGLWVLVCIFSYAFATQVIVFEFAYFVLPFSAFIVPLGIAHIACRLKYSKVSPRNQGGFNLWISLASAVTAVAAYLLSFAVFQRLLELPWHHGKFGDTSLSLGKAAAAQFTVAAAVVAIAAVLLLRSAPRGSRPAKYAFGSLGMLSAASLIYLLLGVSPFVEWRA